MTANEHQVGGDHYKTSYEHWDLVLIVAMGYLEGNATKYLSRWRKKGGTQDLQKALHYVNKLIENAPTVLSQRVPRVDAVFRMAEVDRFCKINNIPEGETRTIQYLALWETRGSLEEARRRIERLMKEQDVGDESIHAKPPVRFKGMTGMVPYKPDGDTARAGTWDYEKEYDL